MPQHPHGLGHVAHGAAAQLTTFYRALPRRLVAECAQADGPDGRGQTQAKKSAYRHHSHRSIVPYCGRNGLAIGGRPNVGKPCELRSLPLSAIAEMHRPRRSTRDPK